MKLNIDALGQRDPRWSNKILGYNTDPKYSIGMYGCLLTCFSMIVGKNPDELNELLKHYNAFTSGSGNFIWSKAELLGLNSLYVSPKYNGPTTTQALDKVKNTLREGYPCICEVDFNPATVGEEQHFVLIIGYEGDDIYINDPWTGDTTTLDKYGGFSRAAIQFRVYDKKFSEDPIEAVDVYTELDKCRVSRDGHWTDLQSIKGDLGVSGDYSLTNIRNRIQSLLDSERELGKKEKIIQETIAEKETLKRENVAFSERIDSLMEKIVDVTRQLEDLQLDNARQKSKIIELENNLVEKESFVKYIVNILVKLFRR